MNGEILLRGLGIYILLTLGLNILLGVAGVLDLGYAMSFALGGYIAAILTLHIKLDFTLVMLVSAVLAGLFGLLKGSASTRLRGDYLAVATLALGLDHPAGDRERQRPHRRLERTQRRAGSAPLRVRAVRCRPHSIILSLWWCCWPPSPADG